MKNIFGSKALAAIMMTFAIAAVSCTDLSDLEKRVDSLDSRITALETQIAGLNSNIEALSILAGGATINSVTEKDGTYTIVLTNGETITLAQGSNGVGFAPTMSVDKDGYWMVDYSDGKGSVYLTDASGNKVKATGETGAVPVVGVDKDGYWTVDYGNGPQRVKDSDGNDVNALTESEGGTSFFDDVVPGDGSLIITMRNGDVLEIPVLPDFLCAILDTFGVQSFEYGQTKTYNVSMQGVASTMVTAPQGWQASLTESVLTVTAPKVATKASIADTRTDVSILSLSSKGFAAITKLMVEVIAGEVEANPQAVVTAGGTTEETASFTVAVSDVTGWYYLLKKSSETAPAAEEIKADGVEGTDKTFTVTGLNDGTTYTIYVLPVNGDKDGEIVSAETRTVEKVYATLYEKYNAGADLTIAGRIYNKDTYGEAQLISSDFEFASDFKHANATSKIYFIAPEATVTYSTTDGIKDFILIGNEPGRRSKLVLNYFLPLNQGAGGDHTGELVFHNLNISCSASISQQYMMALYRDGAYGFIGLDSCRINVSEKSLVYSGSTARTFDEFCMKDCEYNLTSATAGSGRNVIQAASGDYPEAFVKLNFENNIFYNADNSLAYLRLILAAGNNTKVNEIVFARNTMANVVPPTGGKGARYFVSGFIGNVDFNGNLFHVSNSSATAFQMLYVNTTASITDITGKVYSNASYTAGGLNIQAFFGGIPKMAGITGPEEIVKLTSDPFTGGTYDPANGIFTQNSGYGAQR
ncbi:MAG: PL29 family lyase N-terminal domain-containing protein [Clostridium sp.]|nr:PL29 family lyase N-terminal domain-containing protein [Bacteroides sp.]MCM1198606.1 PL29 family lyase N-terminal domain-containing protein [Clostridium sp.]